MAAWIRFGVGNFSILDFVFFHEFRNNRQSVQVTEEKTGASVFDYDSE
jgi:hypothetical protein